MSYSMPSYYQNLPQLGKELKKGNESNINEIKEIEKDIRDKIDACNAYGKSDEAVHKTGELTALERLDLLVDEGTFCPLNSLYNPYDNTADSTGIITGIGSVEGVWCSIVVFDQKKLAGAWVPGQATKMVRATEVSRRMHIPLVYLVNCSGVEFDKQEYVCFGRMSGGTPFYRHAELEQLGIPVFVGTFGTNPAGGGYQCISPSIIVSHKKSNYAVGGVGITSGMQPKGYFDKEVCQALIDTTKNAKKIDPPGAMHTQYEANGFTREVYDTDEEVIKGLKRFIAMSPVINKEIFRVADPMEPRFPKEDLYTILPANRKRIYDMREVLARLVDNGEFSEFQKDYGPEAICGLARINGFLVGIFANTQGFIPNYPEYREKAFGVGGKMYRQGMLKVSEFATLCARDRIPLIWIQDCQGIDVDDIAERAEVLALGQSVIYSVQNANIPQMNITLRKGQGATEYLLGGPCANDGNAFTIGTALTEMFVMHGETASAAMYSRRLVKDQAAGKDIQPTIDKMNALMKHINDHGTPYMCTKNGYVDEIVDLGKLRNYMIAFAEAAYQNPVSYCPLHQMLLPRLIRDHNNK